MNFDMFDDYVTTIFLSVVVCIFLILFAEFVKACFATVGPTHAEENESLLNHAQNCVLCKGLLCPFCEFPLDGPRVNEVLAEISRDSDSSYEPTSPNSDSNAEDDIGKESIWVRSRKPRLRRVAVNSIASNMDREPNDPTTPAPLFNDESSVETIDE